MPPSPETWMPVMYLIQARTWTFDSYVIICIQIPDCITPSRGRNKQINSVQPFFEVLTHLFDCLKAKEQTRSRWSILFLKPWNPHSFSQVRLMFFFIRHLHGMAMIPEEEFCRGGRPPLYKFPTRLQEKKWQVSEGTKSKKKKRNDPLWNRSEGSISGRQR